MDALDSAAISTGLAGTALHVGGAVLYRTVRTEQLGGDWEIPPPRSTAELWKGLKRGDWRISAAGTGDVRCHLELEAVKGPRPLPRHATNLDLLERAMLGDFQKVMALERAVAYSTVSCMLGQALRTIGLSCKLRAAPLLLVIAAQTEREVELTVAANGRYCLAVPRPDDVLENRLTRAEYVLARLVIEGKSHAEMSRLRQTSPRTVANQLAAISRKLRVTGRFSLIARALDGANEPSLAAEIAHSR